MNAEAKEAARKAAYARRKEAHAARPPGAAAQLSAFLAGHRGVPLSGYMSIRTEIDPLPAMEEAAGHGPVGVPVIEGAGLPLKFALWSPGCPMEPGPFGAQVPATRDWMRPQIVILPMVAFDAAGTRLGYGGGFYDRTLAGLRKDGPVLAVGFAYDAQEAPAPLPREATDQPLDMVITETGIRSFTARG